MEVQKEMLSSAKNLGAAANHERSASEVGVYET
jgi:hypothetical protein